MQRHSVSWFSGFGFSNCLSQIPQLQQRARNRAEVTWQLTSTFTSIPCHATGSSLFSCSIRIPTSRANSEILVWGGRVSPGVDSINISKEKRSCTSVHQCKTRGLEMIILTPRSHWYLILRVPQAEPIVGYWSLTTTRGDPTRRQANMRI